jgi:hypothetical protein
MASYWIVYKRVRSVWIFQTTIFEVIGLPHDYLGKFHVCLGAQFRSHLAKKKQAVTAFILPLSLSLSADIVHTTSFSNFPPPAGLNKPFAKIRAFRHLENTKTCALEQIEKYCCFLGKGIIC